MKRAYVFVLREKQREILPAVEPIVARFDAKQPEEEESYMPGTIATLKLELEQCFGVELTSEDMSDMLDPVTLAGVIAAKLLTIDSPEDMIKKS